MDLVYQGGAHVRQLSAADLKSLGVNDAKKVSFRKGEPVEVDAKLGKVLLEHPKLKGEFAEYEEKKHDKVAKVTHNRLRDGVGGGTQNASGGSGTASTAGSTSGGGAGA